VPQGGFRQGQWKDEFLDDRKGELCLGGHVRRSGSL
jgi:hypothetical protein